MVIENGQIESTFLGLEGDGAPNFMINIKTPAGMRGFGGYLELTLFGLLSVLGVPHWESLPGTACRIRRDGIFVESVGHPTEDRWYSWCSETQTPSVE